MPTGEWTLANDDYGSPQRLRRRSRVIVGLVGLAFVGLVAVLYFTGTPVGGAPSLGPTSYSTNVNCEVNTVGAQGTVTINGTITGDASKYLVTVDVLDAATQQRIGGQTFEVRDTTTFGGTTAAEAAIGPYGIDCKISKVE